MKRISERLIFLRGAQARRPFADLIGITESTLRNYEQGISSPNAECLEVVCKKLRILPEWLLLGDGPMRSSEVVLTALNSVPSPHPTSEVPMATQEILCPRCIKLESEMERERLERRELSGEIRQLTAEIRQATEGARQATSQNHELTSHNHELTSENRNLWKENGDLREKCARLEAHQYQRSLSHADSEAVGSA